MAILVAVLKVRLVVVLSRQRSTARNETASVEQKRQIVSNTPLESDAVNLKMKARLMASDCLAQPLLFRNGGLNCLREEYCVLQCQVFKLLEKSLKNFVVEATSDEAVMDVFVIDNFKLTGCQSLELGDEVGDVFACLLKTSATFNVGVDYQFAHFEAFG